MEDTRKEEFLKLKEICDKSDMPSWIKQDMDELSNLVLKKVDQNNGSFDEVTLYFPDDYKNYDLFLKFAKLFKASFGVISSTRNVYKIFNIAQGYAYVIFDKKMRKKIEEANSRFEKKLRRK